MPDTASFWNERGAWLRNEATALRIREEFQRSQLTELGNTDFEVWAKESFVKSAHGLREFVYDS